MRLIDADALWAEFDNASWYRNADQYEIALPLIDAAPTIDPESLRPKWISVEDRLPKEGVRVLALHEDGIVRIGISRGYFPAVVSRTYTKPFGIVEVTHWMPLPEPPNCGADMRGEDDG